MLALSEIFIHKPLRSPQEKLNHQVKRPREPQVPHSPMHNPSLVPSELSRKVLGLLHSILSFAGAMSCAGDIQAPLTELLQELQIAAPPVGFHNSVIFFLISNRDNNLQSPFVLSPSSSESNQWIECKLMVFGCLDDCLRYIENKQERIRRRIYTKKCIATHGEGSVQSRRNRRQLHRECNATPTGKRLTASIPHYIGLIDSHCSDSLSLNHSYTIFLGDAARSSFILLGNSLNTLLVNQIWETFGVVSQPLDPQSNPHTSTSIITRGSFRFVTISPSLGECLLTSSVIFSDISFKAASPTSTCLVSACGSGCKIEILNCHFLLTNDDLLSKLFPRNFSFFELKNGSSCSLVCSELYGNRFDDVCCQSLISCKCKVALKISDCQLSKSYSSLIHLQSSCSLSIVSSTLGGSQKSAIYIFDAAEVRIEKCEIFKNQKCGVEIFSNHFGSNLSSPINLLECRIHSNDESGLFLYRCRCQVSSSFFSHNGLANISCHEGTHLDLDNCVITTSSRSGVHACGKDTVVLLHDCTIGNNQEGDLDCVDGALVSIVEHNVSSEN